MISTNHKPIFTEQQLGRLPRAMREQLAVARPTQEIVRQACARLGIELDRLPAVKANKAKIAEGKRRYREANKAKIAEYQRRYYETNKAKIAEGQRRYYETNKAKIAEGKRRYRETNKAKIAEGQRRRRAQLREMSEVNA